ncbi:MAG: hypothetical protein E7A62_02500 [Actinomycetaceae bacterium]|nr:hypothetical protein [Actinomycetaceae bacterium]MDU0969851.1 hypothetical protein [Actinomycetaceae bacterium]
MEAVSYTRAAATSGGAGALISDPLMIPDSVGKNWLGKSLKNPMRRVHYRTAKWLIPTGILLGLVLPLEYMDLDYYWIQGHPEIKVLFWVVGVFVFGCFVSGFLCRKGADRDDVWVAYGPWRIHDVRFDQVARMDLGVGCWRLSTEADHMDVHFDRFNTGVVYLRMLELLHHRRVSIDGIAPSDPRWEERAAIWRRMLTAQVYGRHRKYFDNSPQATAMLNALGESGQGYTVVKA